MIREIVKRILGINIGEIATQEKEEIDFHGETIVVKDGIAHYNPEHMDKIKLKYRVSCAIKEEERNRPRKGYQVIVALPGYFAKLNELN